MRTLDPQAFDTWRALVDELQVAAAQDAALSSADRRYLRAIAEAVSALVAPGASPEQRAKPLGESVQPDTA